MNQIRISNTTIWSSLFEYSNSPNNSDQHCNRLRPTHGVASTRRGRSSTTIAVTHEPGQSHVVPGATGLREEVAGVEGRPVTLSCVTEPPGEWGVMVWW